MRCSPSLVKFRNVLSICVAFITGFNRLIVILWRKEEPEQEMNWKYTPLLSKKKTEQIINSPAFFVVSVMEYAKIYIKNKV